MFEKSLIVACRALFDAAPGCHHSTFPLVVSMSICQVLPFDGRSSFHVPDEHSLGTYFPIPQSCPNRMKIDVRKRNHRVSTCKDERGSENCKEHVFNYHTPLINLFESSNCLINYYLENYFQLSRCSNK